MLAIKKRMPLNSAAHRRTNPTLSHQHESLGNDFAVDEPQ